MIFKEYDDYGNEEYHEDTGYEEYSDEEEEVVVPCHTHEVDSPFKKKNNSNRIG